MRAHHVVNLVAMIHAHHVVNLIGMIARLRVLSVKIVHRVLKQKLLKSVRMKNPYVRPVLIAMKCRRKSGARMMYKNA